MPLKILHDKEKHLSCLFDEIEMKPIGILFSEDESISDFLVWYEKNYYKDYSARKTKIEFVPQQELTNKILEWRSMYLNTQTKCKHGRFSHNMLQRRRKVGIKNNDDAEIKKTF